MTKSVELTSIPPKWYALEIELAPVAEEIITWTLWSRGTTGIETVSESGRSIKLVAYFDAPLDLIACRAELLAAIHLTGLAADALQELSLREVPNEDWLAKWKEGYEPFTVGEKFLITPSWKNPPADLAAGRIVLELDPGMAFGTGTHETTQLCLTALETYWQGGRLLDVGTGTGILAIAAARLHPEAYITGVDIDSNAVSVAGENATRNGVQEQIEFQVGSVDNYRGCRFSLVLANLTIDLIQRLLPQLAAIVEPGGVLLLSGILREQAADLRGQLRAAGLDELSEKKLGDWSLLACAPSQTAGA